MKRLAAILAAICVACAVIVGICLVLPPQGKADPNQEYGYLYSGVKSESLDFTLAAMRDNSYLLLGSSELNMGKDAVPSAPGVVLRSYDCGYQFMYTGEAYDQSLWMAITAGAYASDMPHKKVGIIVSAQWFADGGLEPGIFKMRFSYPLYRAFCANESISAETKLRVAKRLREEGVEETLVDAGLRSLPQDTVNDRVFDAMNDLRLRNSLQEVRTQGIPLTSPTELPDFSKLREQATEAGAASCSSNSFYVHDVYWNEHMAGSYEARKGTMANETLTDTREYDDLQCLLDVCRESGLEPLVIMMPVNAMWYDYAGLSPEVRSACYDRVRSQCESAGIDLLDLSVHEYDPYYMYDIMHFGWLGWIDVEEAFMDFTQEDRS